MDGSIALVEFSKPSRRACVKTFEYAHIEVGLKIWFPHRLLWDAGFVEWYYPALRHGATHAAVNASTAPGVVDFLEARPWAFVKLVAGARDGAADADMMSGAGAV